MPSQAYSGVPVRGARTLPLRVVPVAGEALDSWLEAIAHRYSIPLRTVLSRCGIRSTQRIALALLSPTDDEQRRICVVTGIDVEVVSKMSLLHYRGHAAGIGDPLSHAECIPWIRRAGSRFCPHCLRESGGRWQLAWRLNWSFACVRHRCLLADLCPACLSPQRRQPLCATRIPEPARCPRLRYRQADHRPLQCNANLGAAEVLRMPRTHPVLTAQTTIDALLNGDRADFALYGGAPPGSQNVLSDVRLLAQWGMYAVEQTQLDRNLPTDVSSAVSLHRQSTSWRHGRYWRSGRNVPSALDTAVGVSLALSVISLQDIAVAVSVLERLLANANNGGPYRRPISRRASLSPALRSVLDLAYSRDSADRRLRSRLARKLATSQSATPTSSVLAR